MIISRAEIESVISAYRVASRRKTSNVAIAELLDTPDTFEASEALVSLADELAKPFFRSDLVSDLRRRISEGRYYVPSEDIVEKLLGRLVAENLVEA